MQINNIKLNIKISILGQVTISLLRFLLRMIFIRTLGVEYLGMSGLFTNLLSMLCLTELGMGSAIIFSLYKPLATHNREHIKSLMQLFRKVFITVGCVILALGVCLYPFLDNLVKQVPSITEWRYFYLVFLLNTGISYFWSYQRSLLYADQKNYLITIYHLVIELVMTLLQVACLCLWKSYWGYLLLMLLATIVENIAISRKAYQVYPFLKEKAQALPAYMKQDIIDNTKAMLVHNMARVVVFSTSNLLLAKFVGLMAVGLYSNYTLIIGAFEQLMGKVFESITATVGHSMVLDSQENKQKHFKQIVFFNSGIASLSSVGFYVLLDQLISLWLGKNYLLERGIVELIVLRYYLMAMRRPLLMYRDSNGLFQQDRLKAIVEMIINFIACLWLVQSLGLKGILLGGIISTLLTCVWAEPYIVIRYGLRGSLRDYFSDYAKYSILTLVCAVGALQGYRALNIENTLFSFGMAMIVITVVVMGIWYAVYRFSLKKC